MDPVALIEMALATGAAAALRDSASDAVKTAYAKLKGAVLGRFRGDPAAEKALEKHATNPEGYKAPLNDALAETGAASAEDVVSAAQNLLALLDPDGAKVGKYVVDVRNSQGTVIGDNAQVVQTFGVPPVQ